MQTVSPEHKSSSLVWFSVISIITGFGLLLLMNTLLQEDLPSPFDKDGDGLINVREFQHAMVVLFDRIDANGDHVLTNNEMDSIRMDDRLSLSNSITLAFRSMEQDINGDGVISQQELTSKAAAAAYFKGLDKNEDGFLARGESDSASMNFLFP